MNTYDISDLDYLKVLKALWESSKVASFFSAVPWMAPEWDESEARQLLSHGYVDYCLGRVIKTDFSKSILDPFGYDRDNGQGAMARVIQSVRNTN